MGLTNFLFGKQIAREVDKQVTQFMANFKYQVPGREQSLSNLVKFRQSEYRVWAGGNPVDLIMFYSTYRTIPGEISSQSRQLWWEWVDGKTNVPKLHYPTAEIIMNQMKSLLFAEDLDIYVSVGDDKENEAKSIEKTETLMEILEDNDHNEKYQTGSMYETYSGTVACKLVFREDVSEYPIMIMYPAERVKLRVILGKIQEIIFEDGYVQTDKKYILRSYYGKGYIKYELYDDEGHRVPINTVEELSEGYEDVYFLDKSNKPINMIFATFKKNRSNSNEFDGTEYGGSDFEGLTDTFNLIDEIYSQKNLYIRRVRPSMSISDTEIVKDDEGNEKIPPEYKFDMFITRGQPDKPVGFKRDVPEFNTTMYDESIKNELKTCWMKIGMAYTTVGLEAHSANISGAALEIKEKSSVIVRSNKIKLWNKFLVDTYNALLTMYSLKGQKPIAVEDDEGIQYQYRVDEVERYDISINFPAFNNQTFEERVEEATKALGVAFDQEEAVKYALKNQGYTEDDFKRIVKNIKIEEGKPLINDQLGVGDENN